MSYADLNQGHEGKIYQASNWIFVGMTGHERAFCSIASSCAGERSTQNTTEAIFSNFMEGIDPTRLATKENRNSNTYCGWIMTLLNVSDRYRSLNGKRLHELIPATRLESIQERAGQHGPSRSKDRSLLFELMETETQFSPEHFYLTTRRFVE